MDYTIALGFVVIASIFTMQALRGDSRKARDRWLAAILFKLSAICNLLWLISKQGE